MQRRTFIQALLGTAGLLITGCGSSDNGTLTGPTGSGPTGNSGSSLGLFQIDNQARAELDAEGELISVSPLQNQLLGTGPQGNFQVGSLGSEAGQFLNPQAVTTAAGRFYVVDLGNNRIQIFDASGAFVKAFGSAGSGPGQFQAPRDIETDGLRLYVADSLNHRVQIFDLQGNFISSIGGFGTGQNQLNGPVSVAIGEAGRLYVADLGNGRVQVFSPSGQFLFGFSAGLIQPRWLDVTADGRLVYVVDSVQGKIVVFTAAGQPLSALDPPATNGQDLIPLSVTVTPDGRILTHALPVTA